MNAKPQVIVAGSYVNDYCFTTKVIPKVGETRIGKFSSSPGGKGFNQAIACSRLGVPTLFIGATGEDLAANELKNFLNTEELKCKLYTTPDEHTGVAGIIVDHQGKNQIVVSLGANSILPIEHMIENSRYFDTAQVFLCQLEANYEAMNFGLKLAKTKRLRTILNPAPINEEIDESILQNVDILTPNELEFAFLLKHWHTIEISDSLENLADEELDKLCRKLGDVTVVLTLGEHGCFVSKSTKEGGAYFRVPAYPIQAIDTTGAEDSFNGGLAAGLIMSNFDISLSIKLANAMGGLTATQKGTAPAMPKRNKVHEFLSTRNAKETSKLFGLFPH
ncbi:MAG: ribokinase [Oligoflexales bacterium]|nr:ribokinase [Oligoflexales bacterium]